MEYGRQTEIGRIENRLCEIRIRRSKLAELIHPYQEEMDTLFEEADHLIKKQNEIIYRLTEKA